MFVLGFIVIFYYCYTRYRSLLCASCSYALYSFFISIFFCLRKLFVNPVFDAIQITFLIIRIIAKLQLS